MISAADVLSGRVDHASLAGKTVVVGTTASRLGDQYRLPGWGNASGVFIHVIGAESELGGRGRLVIRKSGTEPLIRVMAEGDDPEMIERLVDRICEAVAAA